MALTLSPDQADALQRLNLWHKRKDKPFFVLAGYAGTGKTTIAQEFINGLKETPMACAPTGKAASVLRRRLSNTPVTTVHRALYKPVSPPTPLRLQSLEAELAQNPHDEMLAEAVAEEKFRLASLKVSFVKKDGDNKLIHKGMLVIVDEASMVTRRMLADFADTGAYILFVGDPGQLPPVQSSSFFEEAHPDVVLSKIHRQAAESPILRLSQRIRDGHSIAPFSEPNCRKAEKTSMPFEEWLKFDQVITGSNVSRRRVNCYFRKIQKRATQYPEKGDKLICLQNAEELYFVNGALAEAMDDFTYVPDVKGLIGDMMYDGTLAANRCLDPYPFRQNYDAQLKDRPWYETAQSTVDYLQFDYAYAITVHKSQGSEWNRVIIADDQMRSSDAEFRRRWLYTAVTRAKEELVWLY